METSVLNCVNPYDVNPISGAPAASSAPEKTVSYGSSVKLEMEEFSDLAPFLPDDSPKSTDELNTPIFERRGPFNFMVYENTCIDPPAPDPFKFEHESIRTNSSNNQKSQTDFTNNSEIIITASEANLLFTGSEQIIILNENETPIVSEDQFSAPIFKIEDTNSVVSVNSNGNYSNVSSPSTNLTQDMQQNNLGIDTPENSNSSFDSPKTKIPKFKFDQKFQQEVLNTPDVIDSVVDLENSFNILDYVNEKDITTVNIEDIQFEQSPTTSQVEKPKRKRKAKRYDDDDEDYTPPIKTSLKKSSHSDSDSDEEIYTRGRPPRRSSSISSEHSDASKYRELRDKNNEASRKSRLKRKMKELSLQKEADELYEKNVKLKAQVEEYERMVSNFRNNLFKLMLKK